MYATEGAKVKGLMVVPYKSLGCVQHLQESLVRVLGEGVKIRL